MRGEICVFRIAATARVTSSCPARVASVSSIFVTSLTSAIVVNTNAPSCDRHRARHSSTLPTAGGHAQLVPYRGHSCLQISRTRSENGISSTDNHAYCTIGSPDNSDSILVRISSDTIIPIIFPLYSYNFTLSFILHSFSLFFYGHINNNQILSHPASIFQECLEASEMLWYSYVIRCHYTQQENLPPVSGIMITHMSHNDQENHQKGAS